MSRQISYQEGTPLVGPEDDPEGWKTLNPVDVIGMVFSSRHVSLCIVVRAFNSTSGFAWLTRVTAIARKTGTVFFFSAKDIGK